jgi:hypothetical protein
MTMRKRRRRSPPRYSEIVRARRDTTMRQRVGSSTTRLAMTQPAAAFGRVGSRTFTQQRPERSRAERRTSSHGACRGTTEP